MTLRLCASFGSHDFLLNGFPLVHDGSLMQRDLGPVGCPRNHVGTNWAPEKHKHDRQQLLDAHTCL